jgi:outer membrane protein W
VATTYRYSFNRFDANGLVISLAPSYALSPRLSLALQGEYVLMDRFLTGKTQATSRRVTAPAIQAFSLTGTYFLAKADRSIRPFVGAGLGLYTLGTGTLEATQQEVALGTRLGLSARAGLQRGPMGVGIEAVLLDEGEIINRDYVSVKLFYTFR